jgi:hypothetical protein
MVCGLWWRALASHLKRDQHAAGFEKREQIVKAILYLVRHHRYEANSAIAETTAAQKGYYERKAFVTLSNMPVTVARCSK